nr:NADH-quinone oxidoreductase subunit H [Chloroflexota bacterium]
MSVIGRSWTRLTPAGRVLLPLLIAFAILALVTALLWVTGIIPAVLTFALATLSANIDIVRFVVAVTAVLLFTVPTAFIIIFLEMKVIAFINLRIGPNRTGPWGTLSSAVHGFKVLAKEDFTPTGADVPVFTLAPAVVYLGAVMSFLVLPFAPGVVGL